MEKAGVILTQVGLWLQPVQLLIWELLENCRAGRKPSLGPAWCVQTARGEGVPTVRARRGPGRKGEKERPGWAAAGLGRKDYRERRSLMFGGERQRREEGRSWKPVFPDATFGIQDTQRKMCTWGRGEAHLTLGMEEW